MLVQAHTGGEQVQALRFRTTRLVLIAAAVEMFIGVGVYGVPGEFGSPFYAGLRPYFPYLSAAMVAGGAMLLILSRYRLRHGVRRALFALSAGPLLVMAAYFAATRGWTGTLLYGLLGLALVAVPWLSAAAPGDEEPEGSNLAVLTLALLDLGIGALILLYPRAFAMPAYDPIRPALRLLGATGLVGAAALLLPVGGGLWAGTPGTVRRLLGAVAPALLVYNFARLGAWTGVLSWSALVVGLWVRRVPAWRFVAPPGPAAGSAQSSTEITAGLEAAIETWSWVLALLVITLTALSGAGAVAPPLIACLFVLAVSAYNIVAHWGFPRLGTPGQRVFSHLAFLTLALAFLLISAGPIGNGFLALLAVLPPLATRALGPRGGNRLLTLALVATVAGGLVAIRYYGHSVQLEMGLMAVRTLVLLAAAQVGIRSAGEVGSLLSRLFEARRSLERQVATLTLVEQISEAVRRSLDLDEVLNTTAEELGKALRVGRCYIRLTPSYAEQTGLYQYIAPGVAAIEAQKLLRLTASSLATANRQPVAVADVATDPRLCQPHGNGREELLALDVRALLAVPILAEGELLGVICCHHCLGPREWSPEELKLVGAVAGQVGVAMLQARTHQSLAARHVELQKAHQELQAANEELSAQQEELQAQNEALQHQSEMLQQQREQLEAALELARSTEEERLRLARILEATTDWVGIATLEGRVLYINRAGRQVLGLDESGGLAGVTWTRVYPEWAAQVVRREGLPAATRDGAWSGEVAIRSRTGQEIPVSLVLMAHKNADGTVAYISSIHRDISERKRAEAALRESEERFRTAFASASTGMALLGLEGRCVQVNRAFCDMLGYTEDELMSRDILALTHPEDREASREVLLKVTTGAAESLQMEKRYLHKLGHEIWAIVSVALVRNAAGLPSHLIAQIQDITERKYFETQLIHLANYDPLTELFNRRRFQEELSQQLAYARRYGTQGALLFLDLDQFKYVNDSLGHAAGDQLLKSLASLLRKRLRDSDIVARLGGDEFAVLMPQADPAQAQGLADQLLTAIRRHTVMVNGHPVSTTASIGIALFPENGITAEELLARADLAMYQAKESGRNGFCLYRPERVGRDQLESKLTWERRIRNALAEEQFILYFQPILDLQQGKIVQYEALLRLSGNENGEVILPGAFLGVAERFGLIQSIDRWVVRQAIQMIAEHQRRGRSLCLEVNLSGKAFMDQALLPMIQQELAATGINPACLVLEITETAAIADIRQAREFIETLRGLGCRFAIDDFGSGFSSFYYLKHLPVDYLKIDGSFIQDLCRDPADQRLVKAIVEVARSLGKQTIAEFVGDEETLRLLREYGVDYAQGYFVGEPHPWPAEG